MEKLSIENVAALMGVEVAQVALMERAGTLSGFVRYGDGFISSHAAASAAHGDANFIRKLQKANADWRADTERDTQRAIERADRERIAEQRIVAEGQHMIAVARREKIERDNAAHSAALETSPGFHTARV